MAVEFSGGSWPLPLVPMWRLATMGHERGFGGDRAGLRWRGQARGAHVRSCICSRGALGEIHRRGRSEYLKDGPGTWSMGVVGMYYPLGLQAS